jgi:hypothetical protein
MRVASPASEMWYGEDLEGCNGIDEALQGLDGAINVTEQQTQPENR